MAGQRTLTRQAIIETATKITERDGLDALTLNALAAELGVKPPSLYNHVKGVDELKRLLAESVLTCIGEAVKSAAVGRSEEAALREIGLVYRRFALERRELYRVFLSAPQLSMGAGDSANALGAIGETLLAVLSALNKRDRLNFTRFTHAALHGFVSLENARFFRSSEISADESFDACVNMLIHNYQTLREKNL